MKNIIIKNISRFILVIFLLNIFAFSVRYVHKGGAKLGVFTNPLIKFSEFPRIFIKVYREFKSSTKHVSIDPDFSPSNHLDYDVFAINGHYEHLKWVINLTNLKNDSNLYTWYLNKKDYINTVNRNFSYARPKSPILLKDKSIILKCSFTTNLYRLDQQSKVIWHNTDYIFHHSMNLDKDGNIWVCTQEIINLQNDENIKYTDDYITKIDVENGNTLYHKPVRKILIDNELGYLMYGISNQEVSDDSEVDPVHLNDIQPVLKDGTYWKSGDLFLSLRNRSMILLYRPLTNKIIRVIQGAFFNQHDVDIESDSTISLFNNNMTYFMPKDLSNPEFMEFQYTTNPTLNKIAQVLVYNFRDSTFTKVYPNQFLENKIYTETSGLHHIFSNGDLFVESTNEGKVYIFNKNKVLLKKYMNPVVDDQVELTHWIKIYENINF